MFNVSLSTPFSKEDLRLMKAVIDEYYGIDPDTGVGTGRQEATEQEATEQEATEQEATEQEATEQEATEQEATGDDEEQVARAIEVATELLSQGKGAKVKAALKNIGATKVSDLTPKQASKLVEELTGA